MTVLTIEAPRVAAGPALWVRRPWVSDLALTLPFLLLFMVQLVHHQMWRDEVNAFALARSSPDLPTLFHYIHYEGHPWLWYVMLWLVSKVNANVDAMKVLQSFIGTGIYLMLGLASPFRRWEKLLLFSGYFVVFEYTVITRMYGVQLLLALVYIALRARRPDAVLPGATLLGLMACLDLSGMALSLGLLLEYVWSRRTERWAVTRAKLAGAAAIYGGLGLSAILSLTPAKDISRMTTAQTFKHLDDWNRLGASLVNYLATPYLATVTGRPGHFWGADMEVAPAWFGATVALVLGVYWLTFRRRKSILLMLATTAILMIAVGHVVYRGSVRHFGVTFVAFLCGLWLVRAAGEKIAWPAYVLLGMTVVAGIHATIGSWQHPFSQAKAVADYLKANHLDQGLIAGVPTAATIGVPEQLNRPMYLVECGTTATFYLFSNACEDYTPVQLSARRNIHAGDGAGPAAGGERVRKQRQLYAIGGRPVDRAGNRSNLKARAEGGETGRVLRG